MCHCLDCQKRTGSVFGAQGRWPAAAVRVEGTATEWTRTADSGNTITFRFCATCGSTVHYTLGRLPDFLAVALGAFADPTFPRPTIQVYGSRRHAWVGLPPEIEPLE